MARLSEMIILWWLFIASQFSFDFIAPSIMTKLKALEYENTRIDFKTLKLAAM